MRSSTGDRMKRTPCLPAAHTRPLTSELDTRTPPPTNLTPDPRCTPGHMLEPPGNRPDKGKMITALILYYKTATNAQTNLTRYASVGSSSAVRPSICATGSENVSFSPSGTENCALRWQQRFASENLQTSSSCCESLITAGGGRGGGERSRVVFKTRPLSNWSSEPVRGAAGSGSASSHKAARSHGEPLIQIESFALIFFIRATLKSQLGHRLKEPFSQ
ncbi:hypothetical protein ROHU_023998 [Labeo rohita]|uniref:Uncharacterized protein n=1 Tax=Labeo rohita TaxID=84645 RepID=A0A498MJ96_LABRO|nr:hypothetical protein ROHU_023998 [Labeo rohita]